jgi:hypothetical protein
MQCGIQKLTMQNFCAWRPMVSGGAWGPRVALSRRRALGQRGGLRGVPAGRSRGWLHGVHVQDLEALAPKVAVTQFLFACLLFVVSDIFLFVLQTHYLFVP